ncbi:hypothetical protein BX616_006660 [Lobosporangium transversale]|uniref:SIT4 phosphatase-associated protein-domain-containing protein n=1 Tax=Lobosporangium transversale TaxID=64571 RepID=A0A1Y2GRK4_9FUNG|nr:SIT4 phosphatase-associated protein-domain-containing protein [Lobosporangium transversale]KAF9915210.1 hypothetical protein BX616_006660 [Lobosporangium transversale]ORZ20156.1 SIT4 phosphatase-associated protein-domain-containing protein [Lobosporangium transversale]|eukprot:XP_021882696.1 SIT4 phosphatase-associated protein-domain-containing protein [Lobosporangium transversale]
MYWRFGHQNASVIDHLLESGNVSLEELLEQDDLIQECKAQNSKLIEYLRDPVVLQQLLSYITSDDLEDRARFKYPFIACEVIACEVWGIFESALSNPDMLVKFWEFLDRPPPLNPVQASYFSKVIGVFLMKRTSEMLQFIKSQPEVVPKLLLHMSTSAIMDLLLKIISMEESPEGKGTVQWLSEQGLMPWLVNRLDPNYDAEVHSIASQVLLDIIAISQSSHPEQPSIGTNVLIDELKSEVLVSQLVSFMLDRDAPFSSSTLINGVTIFIELIRRNNSDYDVEPAPPGSTEPVREAVDLSDLLKVLASRIEDFKNLLIVPRSVTGPIDTAIGKQTPLGFERLKICEMFAELLHCSNMAVLNSRPIITVSTDGTVSVPTVSMIGLHHDHTEDETKTSGTGNGVLKGATDDVQHANKNQAHSPKAADLQNGVLTPTESIGDEAESSAIPLPLQASSFTLKSPIITSICTSNPTGEDVLIPVGDFLKLQFVDHRIIPTCFDLFFQFPWNNFLHTVVYDMVHQVFHRPMGDIGRPDIDGTYIPPKSDHDITEGWNRRLTVSMFRDGQLTKRITDAQRLNDYECAQPKGVRLGYMGHLTYIADETVKLLELYSQTSLLNTLYEFIDLEDWWNYVSKILKETKDRDAQVLGGTRPNMTESLKPGMDDGNDDDYLDDNDDEYGAGGDFLGSVSGAGHEGDVASDQFARYLCQQITNNLPDKFGSSDEDEDDEESNWIGEYGAENVFANRLPTDFDSDDEDGVDEETWNEPWQNTTFIGEKSTDGLGMNSSAQPGATLTSSSELQDDFGEFKTADDTYSAESTIQDEAKPESEHKQDNGASNSVTVPATASSNTPSDFAHNTSAADVTLTEPRSKAYSGTHEHDAVRKQKNEGEIAIHVPASIVSVPQAPNSNDEMMGNAMTSTATATTTEVPVALAPVVQETPLVETQKENIQEKQPSSPNLSIASGQSSNSTNSISSLTVEPPSSVHSVSSLSSLPSVQDKEQASTTPMNIEIIPLSDPNEPKLHATTGTSTFDSTINNSDSNTVKHDAGMTDMTKRVGGLDLKQG